MCELQLIVQTRAPGNEDLDRLLQASLAELRVRYGPQAGSPVLDGAEYLVAYQRDQPVACAALQALTRDLVELKRMYVPERLRGQGNARTLLLALERQVRARGVIRLRLQTGTRQPEAISLYERSGYRSVPARGKYADDPNALCYEKTLG